MALFAYSARQSDGHAVKGTVEAPNLETATELLRDQQLIVLRLKQKANSLNWRFLQNLLNRVSVKDITFFSRQLAVLISATIPLVRALKILVRQTRTEVLKRIIADIAAEVDGGAKLSQAMARYPQAFDQFFIHMVRAGETTGRLDDVLQYLATQKEKDYALRSRIRGAMIYPSFIVATMIGIGTLMMVFVVPRLSAIITQGGGELPLPTQILLGTSWVLSNYWLLILVIIFGLIIATVVYGQTLAGRYYIDAIRLRLPVFGPLYQKIILTRFSVSLSNLLASSVPVTQALTIVADVVGNAQYHEVLMQTITEVEGGNSIASVFAHSKIVPPIVAQMLSIGEETGRLDDILKKLSEFYTAEVETGVATLTSLIEPIIIVLLGIGAAIMVTGILLPIYSITNSIA